MSPDIDHEGALRRAHVDPFALRGEGLQPARPVLAVEHGQRPVIGMGAGAKLARQRRLLLGHVLVEADVADRARDLVVEPALVDAEREREDPHQLVADAVERPVIRLEDRPHPGRALGPQVGREEIQPVALGVVGIVRQVEIAHAEHLLQVGRGLVAVRGGELLVGRRVVAPCRGDARPWDSHLLFQRQREELVGEVARIPHQGVGDAVARDGEEPDGLQRLAHQPGDAPLARRVAGESRRNVDLGYAVRCHPKSLPPRSNHVRPRRFKPSPHFPPGSRSASRAGPGLRSGEGHDPGGKCGLVSDRDGGHLP